MKKNRTKPKIIRVFNQIWIRNKYGSYTKDGDTSMEAQKNAMSYLQLVRQGGVSE